LNNFCFFFEMLDFFFRLFLLIQKFEKTKKKN
jgi:hypothetical protein